MPVQACTSLYKGLQASRRNTDGLCKFLNHFCLHTLISTTHRSLPLMRTMHRAMIQWSITCRCHSSGTLLTSDPQTSGCIAWPIQSTWRHWRYFNTDINNLISNLIKYIFLAFEGHRCGQRRQEGDVSRQCHRPIGQGVR